MPSSTHLFKQCVVAQRERRGFDCMIVAAILTSLSHSETPWFAFLLQGFSYRTPHPKCLFCYITILSAMPPHTFPLCFSSQNSIPPYHLATPDHTMNLWGALKHTKVSLMYNVCFFNSLLGAHTFLSTGLTGFWNAQPMSSLAFSHIPLDWKAHGFVFKLSLGNKES